MNRIMNAAFAAIQPSSTLAIARAAKNMKAEHGPNFADLASGDVADHGPIFTLFRESALTAARVSSSSRYPTQNPELEEAILELHAKVRGGNLGYRDPAIIFFGGGCKGALSAAFKAFASYRDLVVRGSVGWPSHPEIAALEGRAWETIPTESTAGVLTGQQLLDFISGRPRNEGLEEMPLVKILLLETHVNPTGVCHTAEQMQELAEAVRALVKRYPDCVIVIDGVYEAITFGEKPIPHLLAYAPELSERVVLCGSLTKCFALADLRLGYMIGEKPMIDKLKSAYGHLQNGVSFFLQETALSVMLNGVGYPTAAELLGDEEAPPGRSVPGLLGLWAFERVQNIKSALQCTILSMVGDPTGAIYVCLDVSSFIGVEHRGQVSQDATQIAERLMEEALVATMPCGGMGLPNCLRITLLGDQLADVDAGIERMLGWFGVNVAA
ncbi:pyridoxal phosphate-dependent aminotransferase [bacterium]|nr:pyridoxal phosphate-dependent aminotransferase [bacterium]